MKHVHSGDPRKPAIVAALKAASGGNKITNVYESGPNCFHGDALKYNPAKRAYTDLGHFTVTLPTRCADCGAEGETTGHQTCQYPQDHA